MYNVPHTFSSHMRCYITCTIPGPRGLTSSNTAYACGYTWSRSLKQNFGQPQPYACHISVTPPCGNHTLLFGRVGVNRSHNLVPYLLDPANPESWLSALAFCLTMLSTCSRPGFFRSPMQCQVHSHNICTTSRTLYMDSQALVKEQCLDLVSEVYMPPTYNRVFDIPMQELQVRFMSVSYSYPNAQNSAKTAGHSEEDFATTAKNTLRMQIRQGIQDQTAVFHSATSVNNFGQTQLHPFQTYI